MHLENRIFQINQELGTLQMIKVDFSISEISQNYKTLCIQTPSVKSAAIKLKYT